MTGVEALAARVREAGLDAGLAAVGVCSALPWTHTRGVLESRRAAGFPGGMAFTYRKPARSSDPTRILRDARSLVVGAWGYAQRVPDPPTIDAPARVARYAATDHYAALETALGAMAEQLVAAGFRAVVVSDDNALVDREAAWRAGIGFGGKNSNVLLPGHGSWFVLGAVVTNAPLPVSHVPLASECGTCRRCLDGCPTQAIVAPGVVDARRCLSWLLQRPGTFPLEYRAVLGNRIYGCDDCQEVCPPARRTEATAPLGPPTTWLDAIELLGLDDDQLLEHVGRWYLPGRDPNVVRRNLLIVVGNSGRPTPAVRAVLDRYRRGADPLLAEHATWALDQLERPGPTHSSVEGAGPPARPSTRSVPTTTPAGDGGRAADQR